MQNCHYLSIYYLLQFEYQLFKTIYLRLNKFPALMFQKMMGRSIDFSQPEGSIVPSWRPMLLVIRRISNKPQKTACVMEAVKFTKSFH